MNFNWKTWLARLFSPFAIGLYITLTFAYLSFEYYISSARRSFDDDGRGLIELVQLAHHKSIDYRLKVRGHRNVSPNLALLAVDEKAVGTVGRWPWPRDYIAKAIDEAVKYGAKVLSFDIIFAEPQINQTREVYDSLKATMPIPQNIGNAMLAQAEARDGDKALAASIARHTAHVVSGSFYDGETQWAPETEFCRDIIYKRSKAFKVWEKEEMILSPDDKYLVSLPKTLQTYFETMIQVQEEELRKSLGEAHDKTTAYEIETKVHEHLHTVCDSILDDSADQLEEIWESQVVPQENPAQFKFKTYAEWLAEYRTHMIPNAIANTDMWVTNTAQLAEGNTHTGFFNAKQDNDGTIRSSKLIVRSGNNYMPSIALQAYLVANRYSVAPKLEVSASSGNKEITEFLIKNDEDQTVTNVPVDGKGELMINYAGSQKAFPHMSLADLLSQSPDMSYTQKVLNKEIGRFVETTYKVKKADFLKDKIFIVGATAIGIYDLRVTPFEENYPGAETHLNIIDNLVQRNFFRTLSNEPRDMPFVLMGIGLIMAGVLSFLGALVGMFMTVGLLIGTLALDKYYLFDQGTVTTVVWPLFLIVVMYVSLTFYRYLTEERGKKELRQTFQKYVSPAIVEEILSDPKNIELGGKKVHLTVMFSDVRGFTTISEKLDPRALSDLLNSYLTPMTELVFKNRGTLDKYMGDAIMAFFGAPIQFKDHAKFACRCALQSLAKLKDLQEEYAKRGLPSIDIGIGLNTGDVSVGNMGSETVRSYTVMGDAVNLASRLEGINKEYGTRIIVSEFTYAEIKDAFVCREVDWVRVKGKALPVKIYEVIAENTAPSPVMEMLKFFQDGYEKYHGKAWQRALDAFSKGLDILPNDGVSKLYVERCQDYINDPPPADWDGVFVMKTK